MKNQWVPFARIFFGICLAFIIGCGAQAQPDPKKLFLTYTVLPPLANERGDGYLDRVVLEMFARNNLTLETQYIAPERAADMMVRGNIDGDMSRSDAFLEQYPNLAQVPETTYSIKLVGLYTKPDIKLNTWSDFDNYSVGVVRGWSAVFDTLSNHNNLTEVSDPETLFKLLKNGRIDVAFFTLFPGRVIAKKMDFDTLHISKIQQERKMYLYLNKKHKNLVAPLTKSLRDMKSDGTYLDIMDTYIKGKF